MLFLDEPTTDLDPVPTRDVHDLIDELRWRGVTISPGLSAHNYAEPAAEADLGPAPDSA